MIPNKWDSMKMVVTEENLNEIKDINLDDLAYRVPQAEGIKDTELVVKTSKKPNKPQKDPPRKRTFTEIHEENEKRVQNITSRGA
jgi:hypothetical protein